MNLIKNQYARKALYNWIKSLDDKNLEEVSVRLESFDHGGVCLQNAYFIVKHEPSRAAISFFCIDLDKKFIKRIKNYQESHKWFESFRINIAELCGEEEDDTLS